MQLVDDFIPADDATVHMWSFGRVGNVSGLYDPVAFGPTRDRVCECGATAIEAGDEEEICAQCFVKVAHNSLQSRHFRMAHLKLPEPISHPFDSTHLLSAIPIAPIGFRRKNGQSNWLGLQYEALVAAAVAPECNADQLKLIASIWRELIGLVGPENDQSLIGMLEISLRQCRPPSIVLFRSMAIALRLESYLS